MYGVALEGGGTKGAYHMGALKAIYECGFDVGIVVGTSIGAFNAAVVAQGDFEKLYDVWYNGDSTLAIDFDKKELTKVNNGKLDVESVKYLYNYVTKSISDGGIDTTKLRKLYETYIDEEKLRASNIEYGMVTVSVSDKKPIYVYKENIAEGKVVDYVLASSNLPVFKQQKLVDGKVYIDGGFYDNCPLKLITDKKITDMFEVRTEAIGIYKKINKKGLNIYTITPSKELGSILFTDNTTMRRNIAMGYFDALRVIKGYLGKEYYVIPKEEDSIFNMICNISDEKILYLAESMNLSKNIKLQEPKKILFERVLPHLATKVDKKDTSTYQKLLVAILEQVALYGELNEYKLYTFDELLACCKGIAKSQLKKEEKLLIKNSTKILLLKFVCQL